MSTSETELKEAMAQKLSTSFHKFAHVFSEAVQAAMRSLDGHFESKVARSRRVNLHWNG